MEFFSEYLKKDHCFCGIDARLKLLITFALLIMVLTYQGIIFPLLVIFLCLFICLKMRVPLLVFILRLSEPLFIASIIVLLKLTSQKNALMEGMCIAARITAAVSLMATLGFSLAFSEFIAALSWFRIPKGFIEILLFSYRYIFMLLEDAYVIYHAQKNRLGYSSLRRSLGSFGVLSGSLMLKAFTHSHNLTASMLQRGYNGSTPLLKQEPFKLSQVMITLLIITLMAFIWKI